MSFKPENLEERLAELRGAGPAPARYLVGYSGGIDSTVLLHALSRIASPTPVIAVHVDHQLHPLSAEWREHCRAFAGSIGADFVERRAVIADGAGFGLEAAAREARYDLFEALVQKDDWLLSAHHENDQAETLFLNLFRGSGLGGLAGIGVSRTFGQGRLVRPLLGVSREAIEDYARRNNLAWIDDPSNLDSRFDRNFLRNEILPRLRSRWPAVSARLGRSAELAAEASDLLAELARIDLEAAGDAGRLDAGAVQALSPARRRNLLRYAIRRAGLPAPPAKRLEQIVAELIGARADAAPLVTWPGAEVRRYRDRIYLLPASLVPEEVVGRVLVPGGPGIDLGPGLGRLYLDEAAGAGIDPALVARGLELRFREGGERIRPAGHDCTHKLKTLLQDASIVPWMRARIPLLFSGDDLVAVGDLWIAAECSAPDGYVVRWDDRPEIT